MINAYNEYLTLLHKFESLPKISISESIFDVAGYPHYENVISNILAFYFNPNNEHGLGSLLLSALMNQIGGNEFYQENIQISREVSTNKGGRLDIVIETDNQIIGIENKIFHCLNNDLSDYSDTLDKWAKQNELDVVKIILSIKKEQEHSGFVCVTYEQFLTKIRARLGEYVSTSSQKWLLYLVDFMSAIEKLYGENMEINKNDQFFIDNEDRVIALLNARNKFITKLNNKVIELMEIIQKPISCEKQWIYAKSCLVHDFKLSDNSIAFDLYISPKGWELQLFGRNNKSQLYLSELFSINPLSQQKFELIDARYILQVYELNESIDVIKNQLLNWIDLLIQTDKNKTMDKIC
jgi:hypothetical protein